MAEALKKAEVAARESRGLHESSEKDDLTRPSYNTSRGAGPLGLRDSRARIWMLAELGRLIRPGPGWIWRALRGSRGLVRNWLSRSSIGCTGRSSGEWLAQCC